MVLGFVAAAAVATAVWTGSHRSAPEAATATVQAGRVRRGYRHHRTDRSGPQPQRVAQTHQRFVERGPDRPAGSRRERRQGRRLPGPAGHGRSHAAGRAGRATPLQNAQAEFARQKAESASPARRTRERGALAGVRPRADEAAHGIDEVRGRGASPRAGVRAEEVRAVAAGSPRSSRLAGGDRRAPSRTRRRSRSAARSCRSTRPRRRWRP